MYFVSTISFIIYKYLQNILSSNIQTLKGYSTVLKGKKRSTDTQTIFSVLSPSGTTVLRICSKVEPISVS